MRKTGKKRLTIILILAFVAAVLLFVLGAWLKFGSFIVANEGARGRPAPQKSNDLLGDGRR